MDQNVLTLEILLEDCLYYNIAYSRPQLAPVWNETTIHMYCLLY